MGPRIKFDHDKSYVAIALQEFEELYEELSAAKKRDGKAPEVEIIVKGSKHSKFVIPSDNFSEVLAILRLSLQIK
jgi:hypothetical protein